MSDITPSEGDRWFNGEDHEFREGKWQRVTGPSNGGSMKTTNPLKYDSTRSETRIDQREHVSDYIADIGTTTRVDGATTGFTGISAEATVVDGHVAVETAQETIDRWARELFTDPLRHIKAQTEQWRRLGVPVREVVIVIDGVEVEMTFDEFEAKYR